MIVKSPKVVIEYQKPEVVLAGVIKPITQFNFFSFYFSLIIILIPIMYTQFLNCVSNKQNQGNRPLYLPASVESVSTAVQTIVLNYPYP